jgi:hypothetical protein
VPSPPEREAAPWLVPVGGGVLVRVRAQPGASRAGVAGLHGGALKVALRARPIGGAANRELAGVLADALAVRPAAVFVLSGLRGRDKRVRVEGIDVATVLARLAPFVDKAGSAD